MIDPVEPDTPGSTTVREHRTSAGLDLYKNDHYWFTVTPPGTTAGTADPAPRTRLFGTWPTQDQVESWETVRRLHALETERLS